MPFRLKKLQALLLRRVKTEMEVGDHEEGNRRQVTVLSNTSVKIWRS